MAFDATFWVAVSFLIFFGALIYFKIPQNVNNLLAKMIVDIKNEIDESEKLRIDAKKLLDDGLKHISVPSDYFIGKYAKDDFLRKKIAKKGKVKYMRFFNSTIVADYIINKTFSLKYNKNKYLWENV